MSWEDHLAKQLPVGSRLPPNFKTYDFFDRATGHATSAKTMDPQTLAKLNNPKQVYYPLKKGIDATANFTEHGVEPRVTAEMIQSREVHVAMRGQPTSAQWEQIKAAEAYGKEQGTQLKTTITRK